MSGEHEKKRYWEDDITPSESHSILISSASQFSRFHHKEFRSMFESRAKVVKLREIVLDSYKCLQGIPSTTFTYVDAFVFNYFSRMPHCSLNAHKKMIQNTNVFISNAQIQQLIEKISN